MDNALYTITLDSVLKLPQYQDLLDFMVLDTEEHTNRLREVFIARYRYYEIGGETIGRFKQFLQDRFDIAKNYYIERINAYETQVNMFDGAKETFTSKNKTDTIDLPNKVVDSDNIDKLISQRVNDDNDYTRTGGINVITLKNQYLNHIKNIYEEFVSVFSNCFIELWS